MRGRLFSWLTARRHTEKLPFSKLSGGMWGYYIYISEIILTKY